MKRTRNRTLGAVFCTILAGITSAACSNVVVGAGDYRAEDPDRLVKLDELPGLLPSDAVAAAVLGAPGLQTLGTYDHAAPPRTSTVVESACEGAMSPALESVYRGSGYEGVHIRLAADESASGGETLTDALIAFGDGDESATSVHDQLDAWRGCTGRPLKVHFDDGDEYWVLTGPRLVHGVYVLLQQQEGSAGNACAHAIDAVANVVVDVLPCSADATTIERQAADVVNWVIDRIG